MPEILICEKCKLAFEPLWSDEEALDEYYSHFPSEADDERAIMCESCFQEFTKWAKTVGIFF